MKEIENTNKYGKRIFIVSFILLISLIVVGFAIDSIGGIPKIIRIMANGETSHKISYLTAFVSIIAFIVKNRHLILQTIISTRFAIMMLSTIAIFTVLGTLIIQDETYENYLNIYGRSIADWIFMLKLNSIFHSYYFGMLLTAMVVSLLVVTIKRKPFKITQIGFTLAHTGVIFILIGALIGIIWGEKGYLHLIKGKPSSVMKVIKKGKEVGEKKLDFTVVLDNFKVEYYTENDRISIYERKEQHYKHLFSINPAITKEFQLPGGIRTIKILKKNIFESADEKIPYFEIEVERPKHLQDSTIKEKLNSPQHRMAEEMFKDGPLSLILAVGNPLPFDENRYMVDYTLIKEPKLFQSILSIIEKNGEKITSSPIVVNSPFTYRGYKFYQSNYNPDNPDYSGILVVKDPGLMIVYIGFILVCVGIIYIFYIKPKLIKRIRTNTFTNIEEINSVKVMQ